MFNINITHIKKKETPYKDEVGLTILLSEGLHIKKGGRGIDNPKGKIYICKMKSTIVKSTQRDITGLKFWRLTNQQLRLTLITHWQVRNCSLIYLFFM